LALLKHSIGINNKDGYKVSQFGKGISKNSMLKNYPLYKKFIARIEQYPKYADFYFMQSVDTSNATLTMDSIEYTNFSGYNYLNTSGDPFVLEEVINAIKQYGTSVSASRIVSGEKAIHRQLEETISSMLNVDDCVVFTAGHATNIAAITTLFGKKDLIIHDALIHNSGLLGAQYSGATCYPFAHNDTKDLARILKKHRGDYKRTLICTEGLFSMDGDIPDIPTMIEIKKKYDASLMVDEAHSFGVLGKTGRGIQEHFDLDPCDVDIWMGTLSKALASCGGYIAGSKELIKFLKFNADGFLYSAGITPANTAAALASLKLLQQEPERVTQLHHNAHYMRKLLTNACVNIGENHNTPIIPIIVGDSEKAVEFCWLLKNKEILVYPLIFPSVAKNKARLRLFINCSHQQEQLAKSAEAIIEIWNNLGCVNEKSGIETCQNTVAVS